MPFTTDDLVEMLWVQRAKDGRQHEFSLSAQTAEGIRELRNVDGRPVLENDPDVMLGFPVRIDPSIPDGEVRLQCTEFLQDATVYHDVGFEE